MPTLSVYQDELARELKDVKGLHLETYEKDFDDLCFRFGIELDEVTSEWEQVKREQGAAKADELGASKRDIYKIDIPANRYDLLCLEGLTQAIRIFAEVEEVPKYKYSPSHPLPEHRLTIKASTDPLRPYACGVILRNITFNQERYDSFIDLQDKLHHNVCRQRSLVSMGTHDLDKCEGPFTYECVDPSAIKFAPLNVSEEMDGHGIMEYYSQHQQLKQYLHLIKDEPKYPVMLDKHRRVMSLPPIINSDLTKITLETKNVFIDVTALDHTKCHLVTNTLVAMFSKYCDEPFTCEPVEVVYEKDHPKMGGKTEVCATMEPVKMEADPAHIRKWLDLEKEITNEDVKKFLYRMGIDGSWDMLGLGDKLKLEIPVTRSDVMHECDLIEDVAIAYGYDKIGEKAEMPNVNCMSSQQPVNRLTDLIRLEFATAGWSEALSFGLVSHKDCFEALRRTENDADPVNVHEYNTQLAPVILHAPKTKEFEIVRTTLLPGLLKTLYHNRSNSMPIKMFEATDVVYRDSSVETGARNYRRGAAVYMGQTAGFEYIHGLVDHIMVKLNCAHDTQPVAGKKTYKLVDSEDPAFMKGFQGSIVVDGLKIGVVGILHPEVLSMYDLQAPVSAMEFNLEAFLDWM